MHGPCMATWCNKLQGELQVTIHQPPHEGQDRLKPTNDISTISGRLETHDPPREVGAVQGANREHLLWTYLHSHCKLRIMPS